MAKIKHTKNELKAQREALARFQRFLPMLQLKKQQLQNEILAITAAIAKNEEDVARVREGLRPWVRLFSEPVDVHAFVTVERVDLSDGNIAGVAIPVLKEVEFRRAEYDLFESPPWVDEAVTVLESLIRLRLEREILDEQRRLIAQELRVTNQRVNLFEKVKIPDSRENIRVIKIYLGDEQTAAVVRGKLSKSRSKAA